jgi:hypothetical protein
MMASTNDIIISPEQQVLQSSPKGATIRVLRTRAIKGARYSYLPCLHYSRPRELRERDQEGVVVLLVLMLQQLAKRAE